LETTNWVFNMPSYTVTLLLNLFLFFYIKFKLQNQTNYLLFTLIFFTLCIVFQPIRMLFLPGVIFLLEVYWYLKNKDSKALRQSFSLLVSISIVLFAIFTFGNIGDSIGLGRGAESRAKGQWIQSLYTYFSGFSEIAQQRQLQYFLNPLAHGGEAIVPTNLYTPYFTLPGTPKSFLLYGFVCFVVYIGILKLFEKSFFEKALPPVIKKYALIGGIWAVITITLFSRNQYPPPTSILIATISGGYLMLILIYMIYSHQNNDQRFSFGLYMSTLLIFFSSIIPWIRNPHTLQITTDRYLIISAAGFTLFLSLLLGKAKRPWYLVLVIVPLALFHMSGSVKYLNSLALMRDSTKTESIRRSVPIISSLTTSGKPTVVYFESDSKEVLYHSLMFGFPVIIAFYQDVPNPWNIAYTENWKEVYDSFTTGEGLRRFGTLPTIPVPIENIYSFRLSGNTLIDTTESTRAKLLK
jgi:hypothetical protein